ncbi:recombination regulator RecX [Corynebacterium liangguodongii]|uniref:Regulatory protein RecX n=1 Tax=Corynebacterium liangguodongii TaxID=2079535 RepID=A0A2S0WEI7_9CORY|nr:recombination regulator RecX [Corynebacterium liangguodongii]AWB84195.1 recombination regulator RecX [Corynebacterium liangguodongii]PWC00205.1 recombination regulator RecX [Corynebacterium liangguodongii]
MAEPDPEKVARLRAALDAYTPGGGIVDRAEEEALAPVRKRALGLLDQRARSRAELRERLIRAEFEPGLVERVIDDLERTGLVDDATFAREWVRQRAARRGKSARALDAELRVKGVAQDVRREALEQVTPEDEEAVARTLAQRKAREIKQPPAGRAEYDKYLRRVVGVLARRGYGAELAMRVAREALDARIGELEECM